MDWQIAVDHMRENARRDLPWLTPSRPHSAQLICVSGGPSLRDRLMAVENRQKRGGIVVAMNGAAKFLRSHRIEPNVIAFMDASEAVCGFIEETPENTEYLVSSQCHPKVFEMLKGRKIVLWHGFLPAPWLSQQTAILEAYRDKPSALIGGGLTIGLKMLNLGFIMGFRTFHVYGLDSSCAADGADHAYVKHDGPEPSFIDIEFDGSRYRCAPWMAEQAHQFKNITYPMLRQQNCRIHVHGDGLIPHIAEKLHSLERRAA